MIPDLTDATKRGLPRSYLRPSLLLMLQEGESHGYDLLEQVRSAGVTGADAGGLYRTLRAMERDGLVSSWWEPSQAGPVRRTYALTDEGHDALRIAMESMRASHELLARLLARFDETAARTDGHSLRRVP